MSAKYIEFQYRQYKDIIKNNQDPSTIKFMSDKFKSADDFGNAYFEIRDKYLETEYWDTRELWKQGKLTFDNPQPLDRKYRIDMNKIKQNKISEISEYENRIKFETEMNSRI